MQSNERQTGEQTQNEPMSIIPSQTAAIIDSVTRRSERTAARRKPENDSSLGINPEQERPKRPEMRVEEEERRTREKFIQKKQEHGG
jgi:hypothetical protein